MFSAEELKTANYEIADLVPPQETETALGPVCKLFGRWARCDPSPWDPRQHRPQATRHQAS